MGTVNVRHNKAALALTATVTHQFGAANLLLGCMYAVPLLFPDPRCASLIYALAVTLLVRVVQNYQSRYAATRFFRAALPKWLLNGDVDSRKKAPPGKTIQDIQVVVQMVGFGLAVAARYGH